MKVDTIAHSNPATGVLEYITRNGLEISPDETRFCVGTLEQAYKAIYQYRNNPFGSRIEYCHNTKLFVVKVFNCKPEQVKESLEMNCYPPVLHSCDEIGFSICVTPEKFKEEVAIAVEYGFKYDVDGSDFNPEPTIWTLINSVHGYYAKYIGDQIVYASMCWNSLEQSFDIK